ncbi:OSBPL11 [Bugula neritina]|uniref:OSBPL11 n=1 Tax=Bugula neritina TaxID=10212 RepID=A0A7J7KCG6_BUGNE|nr:OSBPL11 [Bugula neritina]
MEFSSQAGVYVIDTQTLPVHKKKVRPLSKQGEYESRNLWRHVTNALRLNDISTATEHKSLLEGKQREEEKHRKDKGLPFPTKYFQRSGEISSWVYKGQSSSSKAN